MPLTLIDVLVGLLFLAFALFAAKNLPGLLGFTVLQRLRLNPGASYAIVTLCQYVVVGAGVIYAFSAIGLQWSKLQWLVAALGVGLGFGLQEIVANFVSGIILLLERPVRVGDIVTVGNAQAEGTVARIRIRATTIILERAVGRGGVYGCGGAGQGATTPNSQSIQGGATLPCAATTVQSAP